MKRTPIRSVSSKTAARNRRYTKARHQYLLENDRCEYRQPGCTVGATDIDHIEPRSQAPDRVDDPTNFAATCRACHNWRHANPYAYKEFRATL